MTRASRSKVSTGNTTLRVPRTPTHRASTRGIDSRAIVAREVQLQCTHDFGGNLILNREHIGQRAIPTLRPFLEARCGVNELRGHSQLLSRAAHAAFHNRCHI